MNVLGIDPGLKGGAALVQFGNDWVDLVDAWPLPVVKVGTAVGPLGIRAIIDTGKLHEALGNLAADHGVVERQEYRRGNAASASFTTAFNYGLVAAAVQLKLWPNQTFWVSPQAWKRDLGLSKDKERSRELATEIFGAEARDTYWPLKKDDGLAEAALIAYWRGRRLKEMVSQQEGGG